jgi:hypothetical protein
VRDNVKKVYVTAQWQGGADRSTYDGAEELRKYLPVQDYVILPVSTEEAEMAVMRNGIRDLMFYTGRCSPLIYVHFELDVIDPRATPHNSQSKNRTLCIASKCR